MPKRIRIQLCPNPNYRRFHVNAQVSLEEVLSGSIGSQRHDPFHVTNFSLEEKVRELAEDTKATLMRFYDIDGIDAIGLETYRIEIRRSPAFEWDELEPEIIAAIKTTVDWIGEDITIEHLLFGKVYPEGVSQEVFWTEVERREEEDRETAHMMSL